MVFPARNYNQLQSRFTLQVAMATRKKRSIVTYLAACTQQQQQATRLQSAMNAASTLCNFLNLIYCKERKKSFHKKLARMF